MCEPQDKLHPGHNMTKNGPDLIPQSSHVISDERRVPAMSASLIEVSSQYASTHAGRSIHVARRTWFPELGRFDNTVRQLWW